MRDFVLLMAMVACDGGKAGDTTDTLDADADADTDADSDADADTDTDTDTDLACVSDSYWTLGDRESPLMHPGGDCIDCHADRREGPTFRFAGTVFTNYDEPIDCNGVQGAEVEVTDANGDVWTMTTNAAGNFFLEVRNADPVFPITALVRTVDGERVMITPQSTGDCASCHTVDGTDGAPGRIITP